VGIKAAIVHAKFAPFHLARLESAGKLASESGNTLHGIEIADSENDYGWRVNRYNGNSFFHHVVFPNEEIHRIPYTSLRLELSRCLDRIGPDVVVLPGWTAPGRAGLVWALSRRVRRVLMSDSQKVDHRQGLLRKQVKRMLVRRFQSGFAAGTPHVKWLEELGLSGNRCRTGCDVVDNAFFQRPAGESLGRHPDDAPTLISCIRLLPRKNVFRILECLAGRTSQWKWMIVGDGPERQEIQQRIVELDLAERVTVAGHVPYSELPALYASAHVYIQPSIVEQWGLAVNEAMASGLPVLVSNRCGCREDLVREGINGFTFDPFDESGIADALTRMLERRSEWAPMGEASRSIIASWDVGRFASGFWAACQLAIGEPERRSTRLTDRVVRLCL